MPWVINAKRKESVRIALERDLNAITIVRWLGDRTEHLTVEKALERDGLVTITNYDRRWFLVIHRGQNGKTYFR